MGVRTFKKNSPIGAIATFSCSTAAVNRIPDDSSIAFNSLSASAASSAVDEAVKSITLCACDASSAMLVKRAPILANCRLPNRSESSCCFCRSPKPCIARERSIIIPMRSPSLSSTIALRLMPSSSALSRAAFAGVTNRAKDVLSAFAASFAPIPPSRIAVSMTARS